MSRNDRSLTLPSEGPDMSSRRRVRSPSLFFPRARVWLRDCGVDISLQVAACRPSTVHGSHHERNHSGYTKKGREGSFSPLPLASPLSLSLFLSSSVSVSGLPFFLSPSLSLSLVLYLATVVGCGSNREEHSRLLTPCLCLRRLVTPLSLCCIS